MTRVCALGVLLALLGCEASKSEEEVLTEIAKAMPWTLQVLQNCEAYKEKKLDTHKGEVFRDNQNLLKTVDAHDVRGRVVMLKPNKPQDPDEYSLQVDVLGKMKFTSQSGKRPIARGTAMYEQAQQLEEGDCVIFSAKDIAALSSFELGKICMMDYYAQFTHLAPCPGE